MNCCLLCLQAEIEHFVNPLVLCLPAVTLCHAFAYVKTLCLLLIVCCACRLRSTTL
jgi:hypothetical protein